MPYIPFYFGVFALLALLWVVIGGGIERFRELTPRGKSLAAAFGVLGGLVVFSTVSEILSLIVGGGFFSAIVLIALLSALAAGVAEGWRLGAVMVGFYGVLGGIAVLVLGGGSIGVVLALAGGLFWWAVSRNGIKTADTRQPQTPPPPPSARRCKSCLSYVPAAASVCRYCGRDL